VDFYPYPPRLLSDVDESVRDVHIMLLRICEFHENRLRQGRPLGMDVDVVAFTRVP
jgi:hypothetical protein